jgi:hypothetical protein
MRSAADERAIVSAGTVMTSLRLCGMRLCTLRTVACGLTYAPAVERTVAHRQLPSLRRNHSTRPPPGDVAGVELHAEDRDIACTRTFPATHVGNADRKPGTQTTADNARHRLVPRHRNSDSVDPNIGRASR